MPRKVNYGLDYDYEDYDDYDDYDVDIEEHYGEGPDTKQETIRPGLWQCSICTYDNEESMTSCDICGVVRRPLANIGTSNSNPRVEGISKTSGVSKLAGSLFASLPRQMPKEVVLFPQQGDGLQTDGGNFYKLGNVQAEYREFHKAFNAQIHPHLNIGLHKF